jgi:hypothetical protein
MGLQHMRPRHCHLVELDSYCPQLPISDDLVLKLMLNSDMSTFFNIAIPFIQSRWSAF